MSLPDVKKPYHALKDNQKHKTLRGGRTSTAATKQPLTQVVLNSLEGIRGAFYVQWDAASFASLKEYYPQIDLLFPEWLHALTADGRLQSVTETNVLFDLMDDKGKPRPVDDKVMPFLKSEKAQMEVLPLVNNFDPISNQWQPDVTAKFLADPAARQRFRNELMTFSRPTSTRASRSTSRPFPRARAPTTRHWCRSCTAICKQGPQALHRGSGKRQAVRLQRASRRSADGLILMNYDEHYPGGMPGAVASQDWFVKNLEDALTVDAAREDHRRNRQLRLRLGEEAGPEEGHAA